MLDYMKHFIAKIFSNRRIAEDFFELAFEWKSDGDPRPGQFCTLRVSPYSAPLLRRPFAFSDFDSCGGMASIIYKRRGSATELLSGKGRGEDLDVIGPLGTGFDKMHGYPFKSVISIAGGTGLGPMLFITRDIVSSGGSARLVIGCRTASQRPRLKTMDSLDIVVTTDDGTEGIRGTPLDYLSKFTKSDMEGLTVCACGPMPLLSGCTAWADAFGLSCFVSMEQVMACGVGACMGCAVKVKSNGVEQYARACCEGPVFESGRIAWT
jgi:dihydroorotate dehydrogenase electron transfer subunit